jgi:hypothetical protein
MAGEGPEPEPEPRGRGGGATTLEAPRVLANGIELSVHACSKLMMREVSGVAS